jgi:hypothetical protein
MKNTAPVTWKDLRKEVDALAALLADPQPGLFVWVDMVAKRWRRVVSLYEQQSRFLGPR